jgi:hypothetical protein
MYAQRFSYDTSTAFKWSSVKVIIRREGFGLGQRYSVLPSELKDDIKFRRIRKRLGRTVE